MTRDSREQFINKRFSEQNQEVLLHVEGILGEYAALGYDLSLRQLYYELVARDLLPDSWIDPKTGSKNNLKSYKKLVGLVGNGRLAGLIPWDMIVDRNRETQSTGTWSSSRNFLLAVANAFRFDKWNFQSAYVECMVEKDALSGVLGPVCKSLGIHFTANKGYYSLSNLYEAGQRIARAFDYGKEVHILYLGDHDPSGLDMTRDIADRLELFSRAQLYVDRLALNMDQITSLNPPENPAKETDSRFEAYAEKYGRQCWELDAIEPGELADLVRDAVEALIETYEWNEALEIEREKIESIKEFVKGYREL